MLGGEVVATRGQNAPTMGEVTKFTAADSKSAAASPRSMNLKNFCPDGQMDRLLQEMANKAGLDLNMELP